MLFGGAGHGKSALASYFARKYQDSFPHGVVGLKIAEGEERKSPEDIARKLATNFGRKEWELKGKDAATIMRELFANLPILLIFDNADRGDDVRKLVPGGDSCSVIITTRNQDLSGSLNIPADNAIKITTFQSPIDSRKEPSLELLATIIGDGLVEEEPEAAREIATLVGHLPLALTIVANCIKTQRRKKGKEYFQLADYSQKLKSKNLFKAIQIKGDQIFNLERSLNLDFTWDILDEDNEAKERIKSLFACLSVCAAEGFSLKTAIAVVGNYHDELDGSVEDYLDSLCTYSLLNYSAEKGAGERYLFHPLVRIYAGELARERSLLKAAARRHAEHIIQLVKSLDFSHLFSSSEHEEEMNWEAELLAEIYPGDSEDGLVEEFDPAKEINDIVLAATWLETEEKIDDKFTDQLNLFFEESGYWDRADTLISKFYGLAVKQKDWERAIIFGTRQAKFLSLQGELSGAENILKHIPRILEEIPLEDLRQRYEVKWLVRLGSIRQKQSQFKEALEHLHKSVEIAEKLGDQELLRNSLTSLGIVLGKQNKLDHAGTIFNRVVEISQDLNDQRERVIALNSLGGVLLQQGKLDEAKDVFQQIDKPYRYRIVGRWIKLGNSLRNQGQLSKALQALLRAVELREELIDYAPLVGILRGLGRLFQDEGQLDEAAQALRAMIEVGESFKDFNSIAIALHLFGRIQEKQGKLDEALKTCLREIEVCQILDNKEQSRIARGDLVRVLHALRKQGKLDQALKIFQGGVEISQTLNHQKQVAITLNGLGRILQLQGKLDEAKYVFQQQLEISQTFNDQRQGAIALNGLGGVLQKQGKLDEAKYVFQQQLETAGTLNDQGERAIALNGLGGVLQQQGKLDEAEDAFQQELETAGTLNDQRQRAIALNGLGGVLQQQGKLDEAEDAFQQQLEIAGTLNDQKSVAIALNGLGGVLQQQGKLDEAEDAFQQELETAGTLNDQKSVVIALNGLGGVLQQQGKLDEAEDAFQQELETAGTLNDQKSVVIALNGLGGVLQQQGKLDEAEDAFQQELEIAGTLNDQRQRAIALNGLGGVLQKQGKLDEAEDAFQQQLEIARTLNDQRQRAIALNSLGGVLQQLGKLNQAEDAFQQQLKIAGTLNDQKSVAIALNGLGGVLQQQGKLDEAEDAFQQQLEIARTLNDQKSVAIALNGLGGVLQKQGKLDEAQDVFQQQLETAGTLNDQGERAIALNSLGGLLQKQGKLDEAKYVFQQQLETADTLNDQGERAIALNGLGGVFQKQGKLDEAKYVFQQQLETAGTLNDQKSVAIALNGLGKVLQKQGKLDEALTTYLQEMVIASTLKERKQLKFARSGLNRVLKDLQKQRKLDQVLDQVLNPFLQQVESHELPNRIAVLNILGKILQEKEQLDKAVEILLRSQTIYEENQLNQPQKLADTLHLLGQVLHQKGEWQEAERYLLKSYSHQEKLPDLLKLAIISNAIGELYGSSKDPAKLELGTMYFQESIKLGEELDNQYHLAATYKAMSQVLLQQGELEQSAEKLSQAFEIYERLKNVTDLKKVTKELSYLLARLSRWQEARDYGERLLVLEPESQEILQLQNLIANKNILGQGEIKRVIKQRNRLSYQIRFTE